MGLEKTTATSLLASPAALRLSSLLQSSVRVPALLFACYNTASAHEYQGWSGPLRRPVPPLSHSMTDSSPYWAKIGFFTSKLKGAPSNDLVLPAPRTILLTPTLLCDLSAAADFVFFSDSVPVTFLVELLAKTSRSTQPKTIAPAYLLSTECTDIRKILANHLLSGSCVLSDLLGLNALLAAIFHGVSILPPF
ncbi:hypothetical protein C8R45DRAFT_1091897 [Mycena sanguinolenta]|nr:hypothetical protein C8R45DRAFT_1091897 [Mycena sanguinolenta]